MSTTDVIESYVLDVMRRVPAKQRNEIGLELRGLLAEMLDDRAATAGKAADDAMVLAMLRDFGSPAEIAGRYHPADAVIIPASQTRSFALWALGGIAVQWALTLPGVFAGQRFSTWWFTSGLGALWWPGLMVVFALIATGWRQMGLPKPAWRPRVVDPDRINRNAMAFGLFWFAIAVVFMVCLPWIVGRLPAPLANVFVFDPGFLRQRAWPVIPLWVVSFATLAVVWSQGRWTAITRRLELVGSLAFIALLAWWLLAGDIFQPKATNDGALGALALVLLMIVADVVYKLYRGRTRIQRSAVGGREAQRT